MKSIYTTIASALLSAALIVSAASLLAGCTDSADKQQPGHASSDKDPVESEAIAFAESLGMGWNLGNSLDAHVGGVSNETCWGNKRVTQKTMDTVKKMGFSSVRIPVTWMGHIGGAPDYIIDKVWMDRVAEIVGYAKNVGLKVVLNIHHDGSSTEENPAVRKQYWLDLREASIDPARNEAIKEKLGKVWGQIAQRFKDEGEWLVFETMNEVHDGQWGNGGNTSDGGKQYDILTEWHQTAIDAIRAAGGKNLTRYIGVPGYATNPGLTVQFWRKPKDTIANRLLVAVHCYDPYDYAIAANYSEWGHTGKDVAPYSSSEMALTSTLDGLYKKFVKQGIPVYMGEFGCVHRSTSRAEKFRKYYLEYCCKAMRDRSIPVMVWDNGSTGTGNEAFGLIDHATGQFINNGEEIVKLMVNAWNNSDPEYTLVSIYQGAPR